MLISCKHVSSGWEVGRTHLQAMGQQITAGLFNAFFKKLPMKNTPESRDDRVHTKVNGGRAGVTPTGAP